MSSVKRIILIIAVLVSVIIIAGAYLMFFSGEEDENVKGTYHVSEYHQYIIADNSFSVSGTGDGSLDGMTVEITTCTNSTLGGYCCLSSETERCPLVGTYDERTGRIQYACPHTDPIQLGDWLLGTLENGIMRLAGITYGETGEYYAATQVTLVKDGCGEEYTEYNDTAETWDVFESFKTVKTRDRDTVASDFSVSFEMDGASYGLILADIIMPEEKEPVKIVGASVMEGVFQCVGYLDGSPFTLVITDHDGYVRIDREYKESDDIVTWTAYLTPDGSAAALEEMPSACSLTYHGKAAIKKYKGISLSANVNVYVDIISDTLCYGDAVFRTSFGNIIPYGDGYIIVTCDLDTNGQRITRGTGIFFMDAAADSFYLSGMTMSNEQTMMSFVFDGTRVQDA